MHAFSAIRDGTLLAAIVCGGDSTAGHPQTRTEARVVLSDAASALWVTEAGVFSAWLARGREEGDREDNCPHVGYVTLSAWADKQISQGARSTAHWLSWRIGVGLLQRVNR